MVEVAAGVAARDIDRNLRSPTDGRVLDDFRSQRLGIGCLCVNYLAPVLLVGRKA